MDLVKYCIGVRIFEGFLTIKETREKVLGLIKKLKDSSLLLDSYSDDRFNMHDTIRHVALLIASEEWDLFTMRHGELKEWPDENEFKKYDGISICNCDIIDKFPSSISCPRLKIFHVDCVNRSLGISKGFFVRARQLRALTLTGIDDMSNFCSSIGCLTNLRMLCLEKCELDDISFIGKLEKLRVLSLSGSTIENVPAELGKLHKSQLLDISNCSELREIPPSVLSSMNCLEEFYMRNSVRWEGKENSILSELRHLHQLKNLDICIPNVAVIPRNLFLHKLDSYKIVIGDFETLSVGDFKMPVKDEASRVLALQIIEHNAIRHQEACVKMLFRGVEKMLLGELNGVGNIFYELSLEGFPCSKELCISNSNIECIIDPKELLTLNDVFPILESLTLHKLKNMKKLISHNTNLSGTTFSKLKVVRIQDCAKLESVFSSFMVSLLKNLETIDIAYCESMKTIAHKEEHDEGEKDDNIRFPELRSQALVDLYDFIGVYSNDQCRDDDIILFNEKVEIPNLESLELSSLHMKKISNQSKPFENLTKLNVRNCDCIQYLFSFSMAKSMKKLKCLSLSNCDKIVEIFKREVEDMHEARDACAFPKLEEIDLEFMDNLTSIWPNEANSVSFPNLTCIGIRGCKRLVTVFPSHMVGNFGRLKSLKMFGCDLVEPIFDLNGAKKPNVEDETHLQVLEINNLRKLKHIWNRDPEGILNFKRLHSIEVTECHELEYLFPVSVAKGLQELDSLCVSECSQMEEIVHGDEESNDENLRFPQVSVVEMTHLPELKCFFKERHSVEWPKSKVLSVLNCDQLEAFRTETQNSKGGPIFPEEIIHNLETMEINLKEVEKQKLCIKNYRLNHLKNFLMYSCPSIEILYQFLYKMPCLEKLTLFDYDLTELMPIQEN